MEQSVHRPLSQSGLPIVRRVNSAIGEYPIYRAERKEQFEQLLRADRRNAYYTEFLPIAPDKADQDLRDVLAHGLMDEADKKQISMLLQSGRSNSEIAYWLSRAYSGEIETLNLETGDIAD